MTKHHKRSKSCGEITTASPTYSQPRCQRAPTIRYAVLNSSSRVPRDVLRRTLNAVHKQSLRDFAPRYGLSVEFVLFEGGRMPERFSDFVPLFIVDYLTPQGAAIVAGSFSFHDAQDSTNQFGNPISLFLLDPPSLPEGLPYAVVPIGSVQAGYGIELGVAELGKPFADVFSVAVSHEVLESAIDPNASTWAAQYSSPTITPGVPGPPPSRFDPHIMEVCDPVEFGPSYAIDGVQVANFVFPPYWTPNATSLGSFDQLGLARAPLTPFQGQQEFLHFAPCDVAEILFKVSLPPPNDPTDVFVADGGPFFLPCTSQPIAQSALPSRQARTYPRFPLALLRKLAAERASSA